jgi:erythromycin esterase
MALPVPRLVLLAAVLALVSAGPPPAAGAPKEDERSAWLRQHAVALRSIEPGDADFSDLEPLRSILAHRRIVILGEASHGDGAAFLAKVRLVQFLHREMGFDVLAFESGFYDCAKAWQRIQAGDDPADAFRQSVFAIWTRSVQVQPIIAYFAAAARSPRPLELAGVDSQFTGEMSHRFLLPELTEVAERAGMPAAEFTARVAVPLSNLVEGRYEEGELPPEASRAELLKTFDELARRLRKPAGDIPERGYWLRFTESTRQLGANSWVTDWKKPLIEDPKTFSVRDRDMGANLAWLARHRFAGRKIIVWAASAHAARNLSEIDVPSAVQARLYQTWKPMGDVARRELGEELYTVGVVSYEGRHGTAWAKPTDLPPASPESLEGLLHATGFPYAFLDLSRSSRLPGWLAKPLAARPLGYIEMRASWWKVFDALLYFDRMAPSDKVPKPDGSPAAAPPGV